MKRKHLFLFILFPAIVLFIACPAPEPNNVQTEVASPVLTWQVPVDIQDTSTQANYYQFGWESFVALNWPANPAYRGMPDTSLQIGATDPNGDFMKVVWEAWQEQYEIFLPGGVNPGSWNALYANHAHNLKVLRMFSKIDSSAVSDDFNEAFGGPLIDQDSQYVRYEVRANESEYDYFVNNSYYNSDSQMVAVSQNRFVGFPKGNDSLSQSLGYWAQYGATEVKASWRVFTANTPQSIKDRYFHKHAILVNTYGISADTVEVGLVGMHILRLTPKTHNTWYWASFEQVDNVQLQSAYGGTMPSHPTFNSNPPVMSSTGYTYQGSTSTKPSPIIPGQPMPATAYPVYVCAPPFNQMDSTLDSINMVYHQLLANTPFQYYQMIGGVNPPNSTSSSHTNTASGYASVTVNTSQMANATMETYFVQTNCISCHITGYPQCYPADDSIHASSNDQVFTFLPGLAQNAADLQRKKLNKPAK